MIPVTACADQHLALFGLGGSGFVTAQALLAGDARVTAWDDSEASREKARAHGIEIADLREADWSRFSSLVLAPGVPLTHPVPHWTVKLAQAAGVEIIGDIELFCRERAKIAPNAPFIGITGTNGKSTTTALTVHLFRTAGWDVQMGGNIGVPVLTLEPSSDNRLHVLELSSFQIDLTPSLNPSLGMLINLTPDHIDRHGTMEHYAAIKERLIAGSRWSLIGIDDAYGQAIFERVRQRENVVAAVGGQYAISVMRPVEAGICLDGTRIRLKAGSGETRVLGDLAGVQALRGLHNAQNACFAVGAAMVLGIRDDTVIQRGLATFPGLPHRMQQVGQRGPVIFVNDSKATNADAAEQSLKSFDPVYWIVGGVAKEGGLAPLASLFPRVAKAYLIGASSNAFAAQLDGQVPFELCGTLDVAVRAAARDAAGSAAAEPVVLLAPACASYDQFKNFEQRGDSFRALVEALPAAAPFEESSP
jgi:UDP-N-acetylmuramoylalanine--D-glutamate ligase